MKSWHGFRRDELANEMRAHREMLEEQFVRDGMSPKDAAAAARRRFGNEAGSLEQSRDEWGFRWAGALFRNLRFAWRQMRRQPLLTATAVTIAALGVGANTAIVSVLETVMLNPLGLRGTDRVMVGSVRLDKINMSHASTSGVEYRELRAMTDVFRGVAATEGREWTFRAGEDPVRIRGQAVTPDFFSVFGQRPQFGRFFAAEDRNCVVLSYRFWKARFGSDPGVIGRTMMLDDFPYRVIGVAGDSFRFPATADAWSSLDLNDPPDRLTRRGYNMTLTLFTRLNDGVTPARAADRVNRYVAALKSTAEGRDMKDFGYSIDLEPFANYVAGDLRRPLWLLWGAAMAVLLTACANIAVLLLSRTAGRRKEIAIRLSLGATRAQIVRQLAVESLLLGGVGGAFGIALGAAALSLADKISIPEKQLLQLVTLDWRLMVYGMALALGSGFVFGLAPAIQLLRRSQSASMTRGVRHRFQNVFIAGQIAAAMVLLIATGLLLRSLWTLQAIHPGFDASNLTTAMVMRPRGDPGFIGRLETTLRASPAVEMSALSYPLPFTSGGLTSGFVIEGRRRPLEGMAWHGEAWFVSPDYLATLRIPLLRGRGILPSDSAGTERVCLIDKKFADRFFPDEEPIGHKIDMYGGARIVGVVADVRSSTLERESRASVYYPMAQQNAFPSRGIVVRSRVPGAAIVRDAVRRANSAAPVFDMQSLQDRIDESLGIRRVVACLVCVFAGICILLATIGLQGVVSQVVGERSGEIAVRMVLGARPEQILGQFLRYGLRAGITGIAIGVACALYAERWLGNLLFDVKPFDAWSFSVACGGILAVLSMAVFWPARRASKVQPQGLLRHE